MVLDRLLEFKNVSHFKRLAQNILTKMTSDEQLKQMREQFRLMDNDGTGMLTLNKIKQGIESCGVDISDS
jgi:Ca2+-binding EF-hand superfamily protein